MIGNGAGWPSLLALENQTSIPAGCRVFIQMMKIYLSENNEMDDFRRILSHSIRSIQPSSSTQPVSFENIANDIVNTVLAHAHNDAGSSLVNNKSF